MVEYNLMKKMAPMSAAIMMTGLAEEPPTPSYETTPVVTMDAKTYHANKSLVFDPTGAGVLTVGMLADKVMYINMALTPTNSITEKIALLEKVADAKLTPTYMHEGTFVTGERLNTKTGKIEPFKHGFDTATYTTLDKMTTDEAIMDLPVQTSGEFSYTVVGDLNNDGKLNMADVHKYIASPAFQVKENARVKKELDAAALKKLE